MLIAQSLMGLYDKPVECGRGGIGRRAALRSLSGKPGGSSSLLDRTILLTYKDYSIYLDQFDRGSNYGCWLIDQNWHSYQRKSHKF
mgnify:FL=1